MARPPRLVEAGSILHIGACGAARQQLFRDDHDRGRFLALLDLVVRKFRWSCLSYCLMGNHYHLLIEIAERNLSEGMQALNGKYARAFNDRHTRDGCVFGARFWCRRVSTDRYFHAAVRYINLNPVEARFCRDADQWPWSSHRELVGQVPVDRVAVGRTLSLLGSAHGSDYRPYVELVELPCRDPLTYLAVRVGQLSPIERSIELLRLRHEAGFSIGDLAGAVGRSRRTLERWIAQGATSGSDPFVARDIGV
jgi:REP element-mobilizing transposase RayT